MIYLLVALAVVIVDQLTKLYVVAHFFVGESVPVIQDIFHWTYILNPGAAFGMLESSRWLFVPNMDLGVPMGQPCLVAVPWAI